MATTHRITYTWSNGGTPLSVTVEKTGGLEANLEEAVPANQTNLLMNIAVDVSAAKVVVISSDVALTLKTNSSGTPDDTISVLAGVPIVWHSTDGFTCPLTVDVTKVYVTNTTAGTLKIYTLQDATP